jgi:hypothetical protein
MSLPAYDLKTGDILVIPHNHWKWGYGHQFFVTDEDGAQVEVDVSLVYAGDYTHSAKVPEIFTWHEIGHVFAMIDDEDKDNEHAFASAYINDRGEFGNVTPMAASYVRDLEAHSFTRYRGAASAVPDEFIYGTSNFQGYKAEPDDFNDIFELDYSYHMYTEIDRWFSNFI